MRVWCAEIIILIESALRNETLKSIGTVATINVTALKDALTCLDWGSGKWRRGIASNYSILTAGSLQLRVSVFGVKVFLACQNAEVTPPTQFAHSQGQSTHTQSSTLISAHTRTLLGTHTHTQTHQHFVRLVLLAEVVFRAGLSWDLRSERSSCCVRLNGARECLVRAIKDSRTVAYGAQCVRSCHQ